MTYTKSLARIESDCTLKHGPNCLTRNQTCSCIFFSTPQSNCEGQLWTLGYSWNRIFNLVFLDNSSNMSPKRWTPLSLVFASYIPWWFGVTRKLPMYSERRTWLPNELSEPMIASTPVRSARFSSGFSQSLLTNHVSTKTCLYLYRLPAEDDMKNSSFSITKSAIFLEFNKTS